MLMSVTLGFIIMMMGRLIIVVAGHPMRTVAMVKGGDLHLTATIADVTAHQPENLRPAQREKRQAGEDLVTGF